MNQEFPIERRLLSFLSELVVRESIDVIVCSERKGTAVLRALIQEITQPRFDWPWDKVVSTAAIEELDASELIEKRVLVFDELVHHGYSLEGARKKILKRLGNDAVVKTAGFAVWWDPLESTCRHASLSIL